MKVAILFSGLIRTLEHTWPSMKQHFDRYQPDIYFYLNEPQRESLVAELLKPKLIVAEPDPVLPEYDYAQRLGPGIHVIQNDLRQLYGLAKVNQICRASGIRYDWVVRLRCDLEITEGPEPLESLDPSFIYVQKINNWFGYSDRVGFGPPHLMDFYMERYEALYDFVHNGALFHMESFLAYQLRRHNVPVAHARFISNLLRKDLTRDAPYWSLAWNDVP